MQSTLPWILATLSAAMLLAAAVIWRMNRSKPGQQPLPTEWALSARPVFSTDERRAYRQLKEALPHHVILSKLPLVRICQPVDPKEVRYWFELLGATQVSFVICTAHGRVLAAIDLDSERSVSQRSSQITQAVLAACRLRYLRCPADHLPSIPELQQLAAKIVDANHDADDIADVVVQTKRKDTDLPTFTVELRQTSVTKAFDRHVSH